MPRSVPLHKLPSGQLKKLVNRAQRKTLPCSAEVMMLLTAMKRNDFDMAACRKEATAVTDCMAAIKRKGHKATTVHHIMRLSKQSKR